MQRRPWPLVFLAILQILGPMGSILISAYANKIGFTEMASAIWKYSKPIELIEFYALPILQGTFIFYAKRFGYFAVLALAGFSVYLNVHEWNAAREVISLPIFLGVTATNIGLIIYLLLPNVRMVFMNPRLRWWETPLRYLVSLKAQVSKEDGHAKPAKILDLSTGGAGILVETQLYEIGEPLLLTFEYESTTVLMRAVAVYGRPEGNAFRYGLEWRRGAAEDERRTMRLLDELEEKNNPTVRMPPIWKEDLTEWFHRAKKSPSAWVPEIPKKK